ncbi:hypothetical protein M9980_00250 [Sphingomonas donggukensis]|uniref:Glycosyltransferase RgtA/B/C/D-like domain-containing protein n=1 Tax=Sphingomonas donggukensis TaxID=2949093 RepID=A0ABY4TTG4_9SPHN|nr:hypothetical protein [Sphingomonas donggukensis]URW75705.1 hypothetical protein M9980_00250 [Sphingomonas donggukensis]
MNGGPDLSLRWWQTRSFVLLVAIVTAIPLLIPDVAPLVDLPGHMARYRVQLDHGTVPWFADWYHFQWQLIGNLGIDLLVVPLAPVFGLELTIKLIVLTIPPLIAVGFLWIAREVHGRIPATALFALPLAYSYPFQFGFVNFALSMALALNAFALWLRLARTGHLRLRAVVFVPIGAIIWVCHTFGWGTLGVLAFSAELIRQHDLRRDRSDVLGAWVVPWFKAALHCLPLAPPALLMVAWRSGHVSGQTGDWFNWRAKVNWLTMVLRDRWMAFDIASVAVLYLILFKGFRDPNIQYSRHLGLSAVFLLIVFILLPRIVFGSAYADMRLAPFMMGIAVIAIRPRAGLSMRGAATLALAGLAFFLVRTAGTTISFWQYDKAYDRELAALDHLPVGAKLVSFVGETCYNEWTMTRLQHLPGMALVRRLAYTNDQWSMPGAQMLTVKYRAAARFAHDPSQIVTSQQCPREWWRPVALSLATFPRHAFDYVWLIAPPKYDRRLEHGLVPVWRSGTSALFRIDHDQPAAKLLPEDLGPFREIMLQRWAARRRAS